MNKKVAFAVLLAFVLVGCASVKEKVHGWTAPTSAEKSAEVLPGKTGATAPVEKPAAKGVVQVSPAGPEFLDETYEEEGSVTRFPTSKLPAKGKKWDKMGVAPYKGDKKISAKLFGLSVVEGQKWESMSSAGNCVRLEVPNGVVLDGLTFTTKDGKHHVRKNVEVALLNPPSRWATVCHLGTGVYVGGFDGCQNEFIVRGNPPEKVKKTRRVPNLAFKKVSVAPQVCTVNFLALHTWDLNKIEAWSPEMAASVRQYAERDGKSNAVLGRDTGDTPAAKYGGVLRSRGTEKFSAPISLQLQEVEIRNGVITPVEDIGQPVQMTDGSHTWDVSGIPGLTSKVVVVQLPPSISLDGKNYQTVWPTSQIGRNLVFVRGSVVLKAKSCTFNVHGFLE